MNSCILMAEIIEDPQLRSTPDGSKVANVMVEFEGLRDEDPKARVRVVGWGNLAEEIENSYHRGDRIIIEGRLAMNLVEMPEGYKEKRAELVASRIYTVGTAAASSDSWNEPNPSSAAVESDNYSTNDFSATPEPTMPSSNSDESNYEDLDEIPF
ncbi:single-stranded DNA-binding protein [Myxosarcina sp. GI1]|uniref:single-stranded DNA-binding protein n=1 Tax=Myxosarcina sp. GI1 TaxID=1541065 RepID=UPI00055AC8FE|nr:single-stranded DNA-binding protein [Myxosarcina sp. GI1]